MQVPAPGLEMPKDGKIVLYTTETVEEKSMCTVPNFTGKSISECNYEANELGIQILVTGAATSGELTAQNQDIMAGEKVKPGTVVTVTFVDMSGLE